MNYQQITCSLTGKTMKADNIYKIKNDNCIENVIGICHNCPFADSQNSKCKNCHGTIVQSTIRHINQQTGRIKMETETYRNSFLRTDDDIIDLMEADEFLKLVDIIANLNTANWNHGQRIADHLRGYDRPKTWKTDCANCKLRCKNKGIKPACELAQEYVEQRGINISTASSEVLKKLQLPTECICQQQAQTCYFI